MDSIFTLEKVSKVYGSGASAVKAISDVSFDIHRGEIFGIIGMSGAGKSTMVRTLNRLEEITSGTVRFEGRDLASLSDEELRRVRMQIAMIFQSFNLLMQRTVLDNVMIPLRIAGVPAAERRKRALEKLRIVGLEEKARVFPAQLSGGQRQRVAIARALAMDPKVLLCDEATSALDPKITGEILALLKDINRKLGLTVVIITHEMKVVETICDRVAILGGGTLAELGEVKDIFAHPKTDIARSLIMPDDNAATAWTGRRCARIVFDGTDAFEPIICSLTRHTGELVSILSANTRTIQGVGFGQMVIELPEDDERAERIKRFFTEAGVTVTEFTEGGAA